MRFRNDEARALAQQLSQRAANVGKLDGHVVAGECRLLVALLEGQKQDVLDLVPWLGQRARHWETNGDPELADACLRVAAALNAD